jgi:amino acid transporter
MPAEEGGYYKWSRRGLGEFWGFQCGWWPWLCGLVDAAVYITLVQGYLQGWFPQITSLERWLLSVGLIALFAYVNIRGLNIVAVSSIVFTIVILAPFVAMTVLGLAH